MGLDLKKLFKDGNVDKRVGIFITAMSIIIVIIVLLLIQRNISRNNEIKVNSLVEVTTLYSQNTQVNTEKILIGTQYVAAYLADRYENNTLLEENALAALKILLDSNPLLHAGFVFVNNDSVVNQVDLDELIDKKLEEEDLIDELETEEEEEERNIVATSTRKGLNDNISLLFYRSGEGYDYSALDRIKISNNSETNENERKYKINYVNTILTGELQMMAPMLTKYGDIEKRTITYTIPIVVDGFVKGVVGVDLDYERTDSTFVDTIISDTAEYTIINNDGNILSSLNQSVIGKNYKETYSSKEVKFFDSVIGTARTDYLVMGNRAIIVTPVVMLENQVLNLVGEFNLNDSYSTSVGVTIIISLSIVVLFILFCISIWFIMSKMFSQRFDQIYKKFTENLSTEVTDNIKKNLEDLAIKIDATEKNVENMISDVETSIENKSEEEIEELLEKAKDSLLEDKTDTKEEAKEEAKEEVRVNEDAPIPPVTEEKVEEAEEAKPEEEVKEEVKANEVTPVPPVVETKPAEAPTPKVADEVDSLIDQVLKEDVVTEKPEEKTEEKVEEKAAEKPATPSALDEVKDEPPKSDLDEILANKGGNVTDDSFMAEAEKKLEAKVASEEKLETIVPPDDIKDLVSKINSEATEDAKPAEEKLPEEKKEDATKDDNKTE